MNKQWCLGNRKKEFSMKKRRRYLLYLLPTVIVTGTIVFSILIGTGLLQKVSADPVSINPQKLSDLTAVTPIFPLMNQAVNMQTSPALPKCLQSNTPPRCFSPQQIRQ